MADQPAKPTTDSDDETGPKLAEELVPMVYAELRRLARNQMAREQNGQTLCATSLVHEAFLRIVGDQFMRVGSLHEGWEEPFRCGLSTLPFLSNGHRRGAS